MKTKKILCLAMCILALIVSFCACDNETPPSEEEIVQLAEEYELLSATLNGVDVTSRFNMFTVKFSGEKMRVYVNLDGIVTTRANSSYSLNGYTLTETASFDGTQYTYTVSESTLSTVFADVDDLYEIILTIKKEEVQENYGVDFESVLFGDDITDTKKFNYCPAIITETDEDGNQIMHIWYCTNKQSGVIMDHIGYRKGTLQEDGKWIFSDETIVLAPTTDAWDSRHTCDPAVIKGEFTYEWQSYCYLMAYLGCATDDYQKNETGLAVANNPEGPWIKTDTLNPIVHWYDNGDESTEEEKYQSYKGTESIYWGTGMPSLINLDGKGDVLMFYSSTKQGIGIQHWDFSNLDDPVCEFTTSLNHRGVVNSAGTKCNISIPDFAYDKTTGRLYVASVTNEKNPADVTRTRVNSHCMLLYIEDIDSAKTLVTVLQGGDYTWKVVGYVGPNDTGWNRNHNPGLVRNCYGYIPDSTKIGMVVSTGCNDQNNENIFTYRLYGHWFEIE